MTQPTTPRKRSRLRIALWAIGILVAVFALIQLVPYGRDHTNPPATSPFPWALPGAEAVAKQSCYDCHSNETKWWWATSVAPASWLTQRDVDEARRRLNFSEWDGALSADEIISALGDGMPPLQYTLLHPEAKLTDAEKRTLIKGLTASLAAGQATPAPTPSASASPGSLDPIAILDARCGSCHSSDQAKGISGATADQAKALIDQMVNRGATLTPEEEQALITYFTR